MTSVLEEILQAFEQHPRLFRLPLTLSYEHDEVTVKYLLSSLKIAPEETHTQMISSFCERFSSDKIEMHELFANPHNWTDYQLYTAFSVHCQQQLGLDDKTYFQEVARKTFLDYQDGQISIARAFPLSAVLMGMPKQFKNWNKVTEVQVEKVKASLNVPLKDIDKVILRRRTLPEYRSRLEQTLGLNLAREVLQRDCDLTQHAFTITFQELFGQKNLKVERTHSEADGSEWSEYVVCPSSPYQSLLKKGLSAAGKALWQVFVPWAYYSALQQELQQSLGSLREESFEREHTIRTMAEQLEKKNAALQRQKELTVRLLREFSKSRFRGERHSINNRLKRCREEIQTQIYAHLSQELCAFYELTMAGTMEREYLIQLCTPFGIKEDLLNSSAKVRGQLSKVKIMVNNRTGQKEEAPADELISIFGDFLEDEIYLDGALSKAEEIKARYSPLIDANSAFAGIDPFELFTPLKIIMESSSVITDQLGSIGEVELLDKIGLSAAVNEALVLAQSDKGATLKVIPQINYDPFLYTNRDVFISTIRDLFYNAIDAKATEVTVESRSPVDPALEGKLPLLDPSKFATYPALYVAVSDNGEGLPVEKAAQLNSYLSGASIDEKELSTKGKEQKGLGTKNLRDFLGLHGGRCFYQPAEQGTKVHLYFERLEI
ncbi:sensor histidine kinase [Candidatus Woesearchaeota archaeon]|nr:sensor histidine kinase [Candidatus Woesearchaeota archaeon]